MRRIPFHAFLETFCHVLMDISGAFYSVDIVWRENGAPSPMQMRPSLVKKRRRCNVVNVAATVAFLLDLMKHHNYVRMQNRLWSVAFLRTVKIRQNSNDRPYNFIEVRDM